MRVYPSKSATSSKTSIKEMVSRLSSSHESAIALIKRLERNFETHKLIVNKINIWPLLRIRIYHDNLSYKLKSRNQLHFFLSLIKFSIQVPKLLISSLSLNLTRQCDIYFFGNTTLRNTKSNGQWTNRVYSNIHKVYSQDYPNLGICFDEYAANLEHRLPTAEQVNLVSLNIIFSNFLGRFRVISIPEEVQNLLSDIKTYIESQNFETQSLSHNSLNILLGRFFSTRSFFLKRLKQVKPKVVFITPYYSLTGMAAVDAGNSLDITTIDVQHGVQGANHIAYSDWSSNSQRELSTLPTLFWCWTQEEVSVINKWTDKKSLAFPGGNPNNQVKGSTDEVTLERLQKRIFNSGREKVILVSLQPNYSSKIQDLYDFIVRNRESSLFFWLIRLHPSMLSHEKKLLKRFSNCKKIVSVSEASRVNLNEILKLSNMHITMWSSVTIEAAEQGVPTLLLDSNCIFFQNLEKEGIALKLKEGEELSDGLYRLLNSHNKNGANHLPSLSRVKNLGVSDSIKFIHEHIRQITQ